jgi:hypothetical protein
LGSFFLLNSLRKIAKERVCAETFHTISDEKRKKRAPWRLLDFED